MSLAVTGQCPSCGSGLTLHCEGKRCGWAKCTSDQCRATLDVARGVGITGAGRRLVID